MSRNQDDLILEDTILISELVDAPLESGSLLEQTTRDYIGTSVSDPRAGGGLRFAESLYVNSSARQ